MKENDTFIIDEKSGIPVWVQVRKRLVYLITHGGYELGAQLPTVRELALDLGINYNTVSKVYQDLERDGFIVTKRGKGTFVAENKANDSSSGDDEIALLADDFVREALDSGMVRSEILLLIQESLVRQAN